MFVFIALLSLLAPCSCLQRAAMGVARQYFDHKNIKQVCFFSCESSYYTKQVARELGSDDVSVSARDVSKVSALMLQKLLAQTLSPVGVLLDGQCETIGNIFFQASRLTLLDSMHSWLVVIDNATEAAQNITDSIDNSNSFIEDTFGCLNLSIDADVVVATNQGNGFELTDVFNFGRVQGNPLEQQSLGRWTPAAGLEVSLKGFKYYRRWDFHNLTLRAISVVVGRRGAFDPAVLSQARYTAGVSAMTKITAQILDVLKEMHHFRFNYTIVDRWVGSPKPNSTLAVTNSMHWRQQDISVTCLRIFPTWLEWMDPFFPPTTFLETKFYYLISEEGVGEFEDRFLSPLSAGVWYVAAAAGAACGVLLLLAARLERRDQPGYYALFSVLAAACQQAYEEGVEVLDGAISSQSRRLILLVLGLTSMLLYNYYTSSVVSWLLNAAAPTIATMDGLIHSDFELTFEDIGYTRSWLEGPGFYYYSGFKSPKEDELRDKKVQNVRRTAPLLQPVEEGIAGVRGGKFAYHTEPYTASQVIAQSFGERELCALGSLQMMPPAPVYVVGQKRSPYRQFFVWSLMRALERGHVSAARWRARGDVPACPGRTPRALALGQAAPAFAVLAYAVILSLLMLFVEIMHHRYWIRSNRAAYH